MPDERRIAYEHGYKKGRAEILEMLKIKREELAADKNDDQIYWKWAAVDELIGDIESAS